VLIICFVSSSFAQSTSLETSKEGTSIQVVFWNIQMLPDALELFSGALRKKQRIRPP